MIPETPITQFAKAYATDSTASTFTSYSAAVAIPPGAAGVTRVALDGWHQIPGSAAGKSYLLVQPHGNANNVTGSMRVWGFSEDNMSAHYLTPILLSQIDFTAGNILHPGTALYVADTLTLVNGLTTSIVVSPVNGTTAVNDVPGFAAIDMVGSKYILFDIAINSGSGTSYNALWRLYS